MYYGIYTFMNRILSNINMFFIKEVDIDEISQRSLRNLKKNWFFTYSDMRNGPRVKLLGLMDIFDFSFR